MKKLILISTALLLSKMGLAQNVGIGTSTPNASAKMDITSTNSGLLIPRVALTMTTAAGPITAPATSLLVYNTATAGDVFPGFYYWNGAAWSRFAVGNTGWEITGNNGITAANFIGTINAADFITRTANTERMRMTSGGNFGIGVGMTAPTNKVDISAAARSGSHASGQPLYVTGSLASGSAGAVGVEFRHDNGTQGIGFGYNTIYATGSNAVQDLGMSSRGTGNLNFSTNAAQRMIILGSNGNVGIGTTNPAYQLTLGGTGNVFGAENTASFAAKNSVGGYETYLWPRWSDNVMYLNYGANGFHIRNNGSVTTMFMTNAGNVGVGLTNPAYNLEINTSFGFGNGTAGSYRSRTETRNDAGQIATQSGMFETSAPVNYPAGASSWWHLLDVRHSNNGNNFALQLSGSFFDQRLFFRKTNNNGAQAWSEILTVAQGTAQSNNTAYAMSTNFSYSPDDITGFTTLTGDENRVNVAMPFSITIDGVAYGTATISTNGWISFADPGNPLYTNTALPSASFSGPTVFPYWDDLVDRGNNIRYGSVGTAPNRVFIVDFDRNTFTGGYNVSMQVLIHEGSGVITVSYRDPMNNNANGQSATIGFQGAGGANAKSYPLVFNGKILDDNRDDASGWSIAPVR